MSDTPKPKTSVDIACECIDKLASQCKLNPTAYQREAKEIVRTLERELSAVTKERDIYKPAALEAREQLGGDGYPTLRSSIEGLQRQRDLWRSMAEELAALLEGNHSSDCSIQDPSEPRCDCGYQQGYEVALSRLNALKGKAGGE